MNFTKTKQLIKTIFLVFINCFVFTNCETDSDLDKKQIQINKLPYLTAEKNFKEIENNSNLITQLDNIQNNSNDSQDNTSSGAKVVFLSSYNFYVDTDDVNFLENLDGTYHSYTFPIYKLDSDQNNLIQNLLFSFNTENSDYDTFIVTYNLTENERENLANNISVDLDDKVSMEYLRNFNSDIILDPLTVVIDVDQGTVTCWEEEYGSSQGTGWNDIVSWNETTCPWLINSSSNGGNSSGTNTSGGENSSNPSGNGSVSNPSGGNTGSNPSGSTGNSGNANSGGIPQNPTTYSNINTALNQRSKAFYRIQLNQEQRDWLADQPQEIKDAIGDFLESQINIDGLNSAATQYPQEDVDYIQILINENLNITNNLFPGSDDNLPFEWWNDDNLLEQLLGDPYETWKKVTTEEKRLTKAFPYVAYRIYENKNIAFQMTAQHFGNTPQNLNGKPDAFRHAFYQAINTVVDRKYMVGLFATAHESEGPLIWQVETAMDLFNNEVGMDLIEFSHPNMSDINQIANEVISLLNSGELVYIAPIDYSDYVVPNSTFWDNPSTPEPNDGTHGITPTSTLIPTND